MKLDWALLANYAEVRDGLAFVTGGGIDTIQTPQLPAVLNADTAFVFEDSGKVAVRKVHVNMFNERGAETAQVTSRAGVVDTRTQAMVATGNEGAAAASGAAAVASRRPGRGREP